VADLSRDVELLQGHSADDERTFWARLGLRLWHNTRATRKFDVLCAKLFSSSGGIFNFSRGSGVFKIEWHFPNRKKSGS
jgi:hypothetical protein